MISTILNYKIIATYIYRDIEQTLYDVHMGFIKDMVNDMLVCLGFS